MFKCNDCSVGFDSKRDLKLHRRNHHNEIVSDLNECTICRTSFVTVIDLNAHMDNFHDNIEIKCDVCQHEFTSKKIYNEHMLEHELNMIKNDEDDDDE